MLRPEQRQAIRDLAICRTAALGGHEESCDSCGHRRFAYNSCRNRHCAKCRVSAAARWLESRQLELLDVPYFHIVFTLPSELRSLALANQRILYGLLFRAASETLLQVAADPKHLGAKIGFLAVLHTWGRNLAFHPHLHCVIPGGGLADDDSRWVATRPRFLLPVRVLSRVFRGKFLDLLKRSHRRGELKFFGQLQPLANPQAFESLLNRAARQDWVVYAKPPFGGPDQVLKYLARYTHRVAIANSRIVDFDGERVTFRWKDYAFGGRHDTMTLAAEEFVRRFLTHVLPQGFTRIRYFGFLSNRQRGRSLEQIRKLLNLRCPETSSRLASEPASCEAAAQDTGVCLVCREGRMHKTGPLSPIPIPGWVRKSSLRSRICWDTSCHLHCPIELLTGSVIEAHSARLHRKATGKSRVYHRLSSKPPSSPSPPGPYLSLHTRAGYFIR